MDGAQYLAAGIFIDSDSPHVIAFAKQAAAGAANKHISVLQLYSAVRDRIAYDPYVSFADPENYRASSVLAAGRAFCIGKAALLAAGARAIGVPARVGYADVRNHLTSRRLYEKIKTDIFRWHSYTELFLSGRWVKSTPAFDRSLCNRVGLEPLEFDGETDSLFQEFDQAGRRHMEYLCNRGVFADVPFDTIQADFAANYPDLMHSPGVGGDFGTEAVAQSFDQPNAQPDDKPMIE